jgi:cytochrome c-type biogenesis protein
VSFITGLSLEDAGARRWTALSHAVFFVLGFTLIFVALGATATALGALLNYHRVWLERIGGGLIIVFGLYLLGAFQWTVLARERRIHLQNKPMGYLGSALVGLAFGAGWSPCIGPILGAVLTYTSATATVGQGMGLLLVYSLGLGIPFLLAAVAVDRFLAWFRRYHRFVPWVNRVAGAMLLVVGILLVTGYFSLLATWLQQITPEFIRSRI